MINLNISFTNQIIIITHAKATITLKNDHVHDVKDHIILDTSRSDTLIHVLVTVTCDNNINNNDNITFN